MTPLYTVLDSGVLSLTSVALTIVFLTKCAWLFIKIPKHRYLEKPFVFFTKVLCLAFFYSSLYKMSLAQQPYLVPFFEATDDHEDFHHVAYIYTKRDYCNGLLLNIT